MVWRTGLSNTARALYIPLSMLEALQLVLPWMITTYLALILVRRDEERLPPLANSRAWPEVSRLSAIMSFGVLAIPVHFARTRRSMRGFALGLFWATALALVNVAIAYGLEWIGQTPS